jgi:mannose-1-phosphate guanylyltransferase
MTDVHVLVLAGGAGTRFWPASRAAMPKQLLPLSGTAPMIAETLRRVRPLLRSADHAWIATGTSLVSATREVVPEVSPQRYLVEPAARNTAPCIAWAAASVARIDPDAVVVVLPSDQHVADEEEFLLVVERAVLSARKGLITTIGIKPTRPETGFGYVEVGEADGTAHRGIRFVEKPDRVTAEKLVESGRFLWNAGMFVFRAKDMVDAVRTHLPQVGDAIAKFDAAAAKGEESAVVAEIFPSLPGVSIDVGVMEKVASFAVVPGDFGWSDVGSWESAWELASKDDIGNHGPEGTVFAAAQRNHVVDLRTDATEKKRVVALVGVDDLCVIETDDATLIVPRERAQDVRLAVEALKQAGRTERL